MSFQTLRDRYFGSPEEEAIEHREQEEARDILRGKVLDFLNSEYQKDFRKWLNAETKRHQPQPGEHATMLYQSGLRDGLAMVQDHLDLLLDQCREE